MRLCEPVLGTLKTTLVSLTSRLGYAILLGIASNKPAYGQFATCRRRLRMSAFGGIADVRVERTSGGAVGQGPTSGCSPGRERHCRDRSAFEAEPERFECVAGRCAFAVLAPKFPVL